MRLGRLVCSKPIIHSLAGPPSWLHTRHRHRHRQEHENLVRILGVAIQQRPWLSVLELCLFGDLGGYLRKLNRYKAKLRFREMRLVSVQIANGMSYMEQKRYVHMDLAARNVMLSGGNVAKVGDFGLTKKLGPKGAPGSDFYRLNKPLKLPIAWMSIESLTLKIFSCKSDVWGFGVVLWELFSYAGTPYKGIPIENIQSNVEQGLRLQAPDAMPQLFYEAVVESCWALKPEDRPSFAQLCECIGNFPEIDEGGGKNEDGDVGLAEVRDFGVILDQAKRALGLASGAPSPRSAQSSPRGAVSIQSANAAMPTTSPRLATAPVSTPQSQGQRRGSNLRPDSAPTHRAASYAGQPSPSMQRASTSAVAVAVTVMAEVDTVYGCEDVGGFSAADIGYRVTVKGHHCQGTIKFVGNLHNDSSTCIGVELDEPIGDNDGSIKRTRYFTGKPGHGVFCEPSMVEKAPYNAEPDKALVDLDFNGFSESDLNSTVEIDGYGEGIIRFIGLHMVEQTERIGIELDTPTGKNNGTVRGQLYFVCPEKHGLLCDPRKVSRMGFPAGALKDSDSDADTDTDADSGPASPSFSWNGFCVKDVLDGCAVEVGSFGRGTLRYVGVHHAFQMATLGIELDEPLGEHNGTFMGRKYFECPDDTGILIEPNDVKRAIGSNSPFVPAAVLANPALATRNPNSRDRNGSTSSSNGQKTVASSSEGGTRKRPVSQHITEPYAEADSPLASTVDYSGSPQTFASIKTNTRHTVIAEPLYADAVGLDADSNESAGNPALPPRNSTNPPPGGGEGYAFQNANVSDDVPVGFGLPANTAESSAPKSHWLQTSTASASAVSKSILQIDAPANPATSTIPGPLTPKMRDIFAPPTTLASPATSAAQVTRSESLLQKEVSLVPEKAKIARKKSRMTRIINKTKKIAKGGINYKDKAARKESTSSAGGTGRRDSTGDISDVGSPAPPEIPPVVTPYRGGLDTPKDRPLSGSLIYSTTADVLEEEPTTAAAADPITDIYAVPIKTKPAGASATTAIADTYAVPIKTKPAGASASTAIADTYAVPIKTKPADASRPSTLDGKSDTLLMGKSIAEKIRQEGAAMEAEAARIEREIANEFPSLLRGTTMEAAEKIVAAVEPARRAPSTPTPPPSATVQQQSKGEMLAEAKAIIKATQAAKRDAHARQRQTATGESDYISPFPAAAANSGTGSQATPARQTDATEADYITAEAANPGNWGDGFTAAETSYDLPAADGSRMDESGPTAADAAASPAQLKPAKARQTATTDAGYITVGESRSTIAAADLLPAKVSEPGPKMTPMSPRQQQYDVLDVTTGKWGKRDAPSGGQADDRLPKKLPAAPGGAPKGKRKSSRKMPTPPAGDRQMTRALQNHRRLQGGDGSPVGGTSPASSRRNYPATVPSTNLQGVTNGSSSDGPPLSPNTLVDMRLEALAAPSPRVLVLDRPDSATGFEDETSTDHEPTNYLDESNFLQSPAPGNPRRLSWVVDASTTGGISASTSPEAMPPPTFSAPEPPSSDSSETDGSETEI